MAEPKPLSVLTSAQRVDATAGLKAASDAPVRSAYADLLGTWNSWDGPAAKLEVGVHPLEHLSLYAAGTLDENGPGAELGARLNWEW